MITCASAKRNGDRCCNKPLKGLILCGRHARIKNPRIWKDPNNLDNSARLIQKVWRGYSVRNWLNLAGPGVLKRDVCHNEEELVTFDDKKSVYPLDYFSFEEGGKVYWFDIKSIIQNSINKLKPANPYTREPLSLETRQRLRKLAVFRDRRKMSNLHEANPNMTADNMLDLEWTAICQIIEENGFSDISPNYFLSLNRTQLYVFVRLMKRDVNAWAAEHGTKPSRRKKYVEWMKELSKEFMIGGHTKWMQYATAKYLLSMLNDYPEQYSLSFIIMSALHRV